MNFLDQVINVGGSHNRPIRVYGNSASTRNGDRRIGVDRLPAEQVEDRLVLVTGTGRCGTETVAKALSAMGLDVGHEIVGADGTSSHWFAVDSDWYPYLWLLPQGTAHCGQRLSDYRFMHTIHLIRSPFTCIPSMAANFYHLDYEFLYYNNIIDKDLRKSSRLARCINIYSALNELLLSRTDISTVVRTEDLSVGGLSEIAKTIGVPAGVRSVHTNTTARHYDEITPTVIKNCSGVEQMLKIQKIAERFEYVHHH